jgi:signal transduction histidine kinase
MRQGSRGVKAGVQAKRPVAGTSRKTEDEEINALKKRLAEASEQQTAISEILRVISSSPTDVQPVLDAVAERAAHLCGSPFARVLLRDGDTLRTAANYSTESGMEPAESPPTPLKRSTINGRAVLDRETIHLADVLPLLDTEFPDARPNIVLGGHRAVLAVPLMREGDAYGSITVFRRTPGLFSPNRVAVVETFARQAAIAIENVRLFNETREALNQQRASAEVLATISSSIADTKPVFDKILESCHRLFSGTTIGMPVVGPDGLLRISAFHGTGREQMERIFPAPIDGSTGAGLAILRRDVVHFGDIEHDAGVPERALHGCRAVGVKAAIFAPMLWESKGIGAIFVGRDYVGPFSDKEIALLKTFADQAVIAIQNARLFREIQEKSRQLEIASQHKSEFLANMSHELRTPLNAIIGFSEVLSERMFGEINEKQAEYVGDILQSGQHLLSLINDILDLSKIEAGRMELELSDFNLPSTIEHTVMLVRERAVRRGITLGRTIDERLGSVRADERKVKQVLLNLLSNALKFTPEGGKIDVRGAANDDVAEISVTDTGIGIAPEDQDRVFEEFQQVGTASKKVEGTGLGLAISRKFIELHGGRIWVKSTVGSGSTFAFTLPLR